MALHSKPWPVLLRLDCSSHRSIRLWRGYGGSCTTNTVPVLFKYFFLYFFYSRLAHLQSAWDFHLHKSAIEPHLFCAIVPICQGHRTCARKTLLFFYARSCANAMADGACRHQLSRALLFLFLQSQSSASRLFCTGLFCSEAYSFSQSKKLPYFCGLYPLLLRPHRLFL